MDWFCSFDFSWSIFQFLEQGRFLVKRWIEEQKKDKEKNGSKGREGRGERKELGMGGAESQEEEGIK